MSTGPILFFDGVRNLCNGAVQFVIRHDKKGRVRFASLQSGSGQQAMDEVSATTGSVPDSLILFENGMYYTESDAALRLAAYLDGGWSALRHLWIFPRFVRDAVYKLIARYRYRMFGKREACMLPTPELKQRFLDD